MIAHACDLEAVSPQLVVDMLKALDGSNLKGLTGWRGACGFVVRARANIHAQRYDRLAIVNA
jgi:hypothetical protein